MKEYTERVDGFQIRDVAYLGHPPKDAPIRFDIVKWVQTEPEEVMCYWTNEHGGIECGRKVQTEYCFSVGTLEWNARESCFVFRSVGLRWLEENPTEAVRQMILRFCEEKEREILGTE